MKASFIPVFRLSLIAVTLLGAGSAAFGADQEPLNDSAAAFIRQYCVECHGGKKPKADLSLEAMTQVTVGNAPTWDLVIEQVATNQMPPKKGTQPGDGDRSAFVESMKVSLASVGLMSDIDHKLRQPAYANLISHEKLFDGSQRGPAYSPPRLWRMHPEAYDLFLKGFGGQLQQGGPLSRPFTVGEGKGEPGNYAGLVQADEATLSQLMLNCKQIAQYQTVGFKKMEKDRKTNEMVERIIRKAPDSFDAIMTSKDAPTGAQIAAAVKEEFQLVLSRSPSPEEAAAFEGLLKEAIQIGGKERGLRTMAMAVLLRPEAIYRMEVGLGEKLEDGRRLLSSYELAHAISYALTDESPDKLLLGPPRANDRSKRPTEPSLLQLAEQGKLATREDVRRVATQIWDNEDIDKPRILRFFQEYFGYQTADTVFKGDRANRAFSVDKLVKDADMLVMHIVKNDRDVFKELLTTDKFFVYGTASVEDYERRIKYATDRVSDKNKNDVNYKYFVERTAKGLRPMPQANPTWRTTVRFYNLHEDTWDYPIEQPFAMPQGQRVGILTHPAWLVAWSGNFENDPIRRGKWVLEHLLAGSVPDVPITVDARVPQDPHKTLRQRLEVTRQTYCWQCHQKMNPLGMPFEAYDDFGQFRALEGLGETKALAKPKETAPVVTSGAIIDSGDPSIDGPVKDVRELMHRLADSPRVRQSFVRHAFRYWMGRNEMMSDSPTLIVADKAYADNGGSFKAMVIELLSSDSFLYRK